MYGNLVSWRTNKQNLEALSTTEAEAVALCTSVCELIYIRKVLNDFEVKVESPIRIYEDNQGTIKLLRNYRNNSRCKHIVVRVDFVLDLLRKREIDIVYFS